MHLFSILILFENESLCTSSTGVWIRLFKCVEHLSVWRDCWFTHYSVLLFVEVLYSHTNGSEVCFFSSLPHLLTLFAVCVRFLLCAVDLSPSQLLSHLYCLILFWLERGVHRDSSLYLSCVRKREIISITKNVFKNSLTWIMHF